MSLRTFKNWCLIGQNYFTILMILFYNDTFPKCGNIHCTSYQARKLMLLNKQFLQHYSVLRDTLVKNSDKLDEKSVMNIYFLAFSEHILSSIVVDYT